MYFRFGFRTHAPKIRNLGTNASMRIFRTTIIASMVPAAKKLAIVTVLRVGLWYWSLW